MKLKGGCSLNYCDNSTVTVPASYDDNLGNSEVKADHVPVTTVTDTMALNISRSAYKLRSPNAVVNYRLDKDEASNKKKKSYKVKGVYKRYAKEDLLRAMELYKEKKITHRMAYEKYGIPKTTFHYYLNQAGYLRKKHKTHDDKIKSVAVMADMQSSQDTLRKEPKCETKTQVKEHLPLDLTSCNHQTTIGITLPSKKIERYSKYSYKCNRSFSDEQLNQALASVLSCAMTQRRASLVYNVPRKTLRNKLKQTGNYYGRLHRLMCSTDGIQRDGGNLQKTGLCKVMIPNPNAFDNKQLENNVDNAKPIVTYLNSDVFNDCTAESVHVDTNKDTSLLKSLLTKEREKCLSSELQKKSITQQDQNKESEIVEEKHFACKDKEQNEDSFFSECFVEAVLDDNALISEVEPPPPNTKLLHSENESSNACNISELTSKPSEEQCSITVHINNDFSSVTTSSSKTKRKVRRRDCGIKKRRYKCYTKLMLIEAINLVKQNKLKAKDASLMYGIPRATLHGYTRRRYYTPKKKFTSVVSQLLNASRNAVAAEMDSTGDGHYQHQISRFRAQELISSVKKQKLNYISGKLNAKLDPIRVNHSLSSENIENMDCNDGKIEKLDCNVLSDQNVVDCNNENNEKGDSNYENTIMHCDIVFKQDGEASVVQDHNHHSDEEEGQKAMYVSPSKCNSFSPFARKRRIFGGFNSYVDVKLQQAMQHVKDDSMSILQACKMFGIPRDLLVNKLIKQNRRYGNADFRKYSDETLHQALRLINKSGMTKRQASLTFNIARKTLSDYLNSSHKQDLLKHKLIMLREAKLHQDKKVDDDFCLSDEEEVDEDVQIEIDVAQEEDLGKSKTLLGMPVNTNPTDVTAEPAQDLRPSLSSLKSDLLNPVTSSHLKNKGDALTTEVQKHVESHLRAQNTEDTVTTCEKDDDHAEDDCIYDSTFIKAPAQEIPGPLNGKVNVAVVDTSVVNKSPQGKIDAVNEESATCDASTSTCDQLVALMRLNAVLQLTALAKLQSQAASTSPLPSGQQPSYQLNLQQDKLFLDNSKSLYGHGYKDKFCFGNSKPVENVKELQTGITGSILPGHSPVDKTKLCSNNKPVFKLNESVDIAIISNETTSKNVSTKNSNNSEKIAERCGSKSYFLTPHTPLFKLNESVDIAVISNREDKYKKRTSSKVYVDVGDKEAVQSGSALQLAINAVIENRLTQRAACQKFGVHRFTLWSKLKQLANNLSPTATRPYSEEDLELAVSLVKEHQLPQVAVAKMFGIPRATLYGHLRKEGIIPMDEGVPEHEPRGDEEQKHVKLPNELPDHGKEKLLTDTSASIIQQIQAVLSKPGYPQKLNSYNHNENKHMKDPVAMQNVTDSGRTELGVTNERKSSNSTSQRQFAQLIERDRIISSDKHHQSKQLKINYVSPLSFSKPPINVFNPNPAANTQCNRKSDSHLFVNTDLNPDKIIRDEQCHSDAAGHEGHRDTKSGESNQGNGDIRSVNLLKTYEPSSIQSNSKTAGSNIKEGKGFLEFKQRPKTLPEWENFRRNCLPGDSLDSEDVLDVVCFKEEPKDYVDILEDVAHVDSRKELDQRGLHSSVYNSCI